MKMIKNFTLLVLIYVFAASCDDDSLWVVESYEVLGPVLTTTASLENVTDFYELDGDATLVPSSIGLVADNELVPSFSYNGTIVMNILNITEHFTEIRTNFVKFGMTIDNQLPIPLGAGTEIVFFNSGTNDEVHTYVVSDDIPPFVKREIVLDLELTSDVVFTSDLDIAARNISTPGSNGELVTIDASNYVQVNFDYVFLDLHSAVIRPDREFIVDDVMEFNAFSEEDRNEEENPEVVGELRIYSANAYPLEVEIKLEFLDDAQQVVFSLFEGDDFTMQPALSNPSGDVLEIIESQSVIPIDRDKWEKLRKSTQVLVSLNINSFHLTEPTRIIAENSQLDLQIVADLIINPR